MKELENTLITITKEKQRDNLLVKISEEYLNQRNYVKSLALISDINQSAVKAKALIYCIVSIRSLGFIPELKWFYYELQKLTSQLTSHKNEQLLKSIYLDLYKYDIDQNEIDIKQLSFLVLNNDKIKFQKDKIILNIIDSHVKYGDFALNDSLLNSISNRFDRINGVLIISKSLVKRSQTQKALEIIEKHLHNADDIDTVLGKIIELLIDFKQFKLSMNLVKRIEDNSLKSFLLQELSIKCFKINKVLLSNSALKLAHETTLKIKDDLFKIFGLVGMAETYVKLGKLPEFERIIKDIDLLKNTQEEIFKENIEGVLEKKFTAIKLYTGDIELTKQLIKKRNNSLDLVDIIPHLIKNGFIKFAISTLDNITDLNIRLLSISKIAHELKLTGEKKISNQLIDDLISEIKKCKNGTIKDKTIIKIMVDLLEVGDFCSAEIIDRTVSGAGFQMKNWKNILHTSGLKLDNVRFYEKINQIESKELRKLCEQEWLLKGRILDFDKKNSVHPIILCSRDLSTLSTVVSYNVLNQIYFGKTTEEQIGRYLETFDLQWAIDIKNQLPN
jgi:hypothetical protein